MFYISLIFHDFLTNADLSFDDWPMYCCWTAAIYISELTFFLSSAFAETLLTNHFRVPRFNLELAFPIRHIVVVTSGCEATKA